MVSKKRENFARCSSSNMGDFQVAEAARCCVPVPVFLDGGVRHRTDVFEVLVLGVSEIFVSDMPQVLTNAVKFTRSSHPV